MKAGSVRRPVHIAVLVSGGGTNLQALIDAEKAGSLRSGKLSVVISDRKGAYALTRATENGIDAVLLNRKDFPDKASFETDLLRELKKRNIEVVILAGFLTILSETFIRSFPKRILNVHPSLIPSFCGEGFYGLKVHEAALARGVKVTGATVHFVNEIPDGGEIILQKAVSIRKSDTPESLQRRVMEQAEWKLLPRAAELVCADLIRNQQTEQ
ncbi:MAG: phosphoribosylglycinamide formyltransferase [Clostridia bacterium]|nr:phosphoribosylglycinamide formyltransferase [Clostridia bacterium]